MMAYKNFYKDILFVEGDLEGVVRKHLIQTELTGTFSAHLKNLNDVKDSFVKSAQLQGCNCIVDFEYGQKHRLFAFDDVFFWGKGVLASVDESTFQSIREKLKK